MAGDLHARLQAAITARLEVARAATPGPWSAENVYRPLPGCRCLSCDAEEPYGKAIHEIDAVGEDASPTLKPADADYIAFHNPVDAIRRYERDLKVLERHYIIWRDIGWLERDDGEIVEGSDELPVCDHCVPKHSSFGSRAEVPEGACVEVRDLLDVYPEVTRDV